MNWKAISLFALAIRTTNILLLNSTTYWSTHSTWMQRRFIQEIYFAVQRIHFPIFSQHSYSEDALSLSWLLQRGNSVSWQKSSSHPTLRLHWCKQNPVISLQNLVCKLNQRKLLQNTEGKEISYWLSSCSLSELFPVKMQNSHSSVGSLCTDTNAAWAFESLISWQQWTNTGVFALHV